MFACLDEQLVVIVVADQTNTIGITCSLASSKDHALKLFDTKARLKVELTDSIYVSPTAKYQTHELTFSANFSLH